MGDEQWSRAAYTRRLFDAFSLRLGGAFFVLSNLYLVLLTCPYFLYVIDTLLLKRTQHILANMSHISNTSTSFAEQRKKQLVLVKKLRALG